MAEQGSCAVYHNTGTPAKPADARPGAQASLSSVSADDEYAVEDEWNERDEEDEDYIPTDEEPVPEPTTFILFNISIDTRC